MSGDGEYDPDQMVPMHVDGTIVDDYVEQMHPAQEQYVVVASVVLDNCKLRKRNAELAESNRRCDMQAAAFASQLQIIIEELDLEKGKGKKKARAIVALMAKIMKHNAKEAKSRAKKGLLKAKLKTKTELNKALEEDNYLLRTEVNALRSLLKDDNS